MAVAFVLGAELATAAPVAAQLRVELVTFGPGATVSESFGHSAIRLTETSTDGVDRLYNLGHADPDGVGFYLDVLAGEATFVGVEREADAELDRYRAADRSIRRQELTLEAERGRWLARELRTRVPEGGMTYRYDYLRKNCTTQVRDLLDAATDGALMREAERYDALGDRRTTYRELTMVGFSRHYPILLGTDIISGPEVDHPLRRWDELYLPNPLHDTVAAVPGLAPRSVLDYARHGPPVHSDHTHLARFAVLLLSVVVAFLLLGATRCERLRPIAGAGLMFVAPMIAMTGIGACFLMATSSLTQLAWTESVLVMWPTDLILLYPGLMWLRRREVRRAAALRLYLSSRLGVIAGVVGTKLIGWAIQDNALFIAATAAVLVSTLAALLEIERR